MKNMNVLFMMLMFCFINNLVAMNHDVLKKRRRSYHLPTSTGQMSIHLNEPELGSLWRRRNSQGSISLTPRQWDILRRLQEKQKKAKNQIELQKLKEELNNSKKN